MRFLTNILAKAGLIVDGTTQLNTIANATIDTDKFLVSDGGVVKYRTGAEVAADIGASNLASSTLKHEVKLGEAISKGQAVYVSSADGTNMIVSKASNASEATSSKTLGLLETGGAINAKVNVITEGLLAGLDTSTATIGDPVWLGTNGNLIFGLVNKPYAPAHLVFVGIVTRVNLNNGEIFIKVQNGFELKEIHDVQITTTPSDNSVLSYELSTGLYKMKSIATLLGYTPADAARTLTINGTTYDLSANRTWNVGTVTSVGLTSATSGVTIGNTPITGSGNITLAIATATSTQNGLLSSTDWSTFNNKQNAITLTTTGSSGAATFVSSTLNIPNYTLSGLGGVPSSRQLTINGTAYDLSADRSWSVGTVTSVGLSAPTGFSVGSSPVTGSGTIALSFAAGYSLPTTASQSNWDTAYTNRITSLTTTGTSGAATLVSNVLNIPQYQAQGSYITSLTGEATASGPGSASVTLSTSAVTGKVLTGLNVTGGTVLATDSILTAFGKLQNQVNGLAGGVTYQGAWNASTNSPSLTSSVGTKGYYYVVSVAGSTNLNGITDWKLGDWAIFNGTAWEKVDNTDAVVSVNGFTGAVSLTTTNIAEGTNLYYTDARARAAISLTTTGSSGAATYTGGVLNIPQYSLSGLGGVPTSRQLTINGTAYDLSADRTWTITDISGNSATTSQTNFSSLTVNSNTVLHAGNYNSYAPTLTGTGASGTWSISITGNAATASNSSLVNGISVNQIFNNMGNNHGTYTNFNSIPNFGVYYVQGNTNGPSTGAAQFYGFTLGLGNEYAYASYAMQIAFPRWENASDRYISMRTREAGTWGAWQRVFAGYADTAGNATTTSAVSGTTNYIPKFTSSSAIGNSVIYESGGSIGINTSSPAYKLDVNGTARASGMTLNAFATGTSGGNLELGFDGTQGVVQAYNRSASWIPLFLSGSDVRFYPNGSEVMRVTSTGLGINNTSPSVKFEINTPTAGYTGFTGSSNAARFNTLPGSGQSTALLLTQYLGDVGTDTTVDIDFAAVDSNSVLGSQPQARIGYTAVYNPLVNTSPIYEARGYFRIATRSEDSTGTLIDRLLIDHLGTLRLLNYTTNGFLKFSNSDGTVTVDTNTYLTAESDTLGTVTSRGASTSTAVSLNGGATIGGITNNGDLVNNGKIVVQNYTDGTSTRGIFMWAAADTNWGIYMAQSGAGRSLSNGTATTSIDGQTSHHVRFRVAAGSPNGFIWENNSEQALMSLKGDNGNLYTRGQIYAGNSTSNLVLHTGNYTTYAASSANFKHLGTGVNYDVDRTMKTSGGLAVYSGYSSGTNRPTTYDVAAQFSVDGNRGFELAADWISTSGPALFARSLRDCCQNWSSWITILTSLNYNSYSPTLTGGGASGTWGINITGSAGSASTVTHYASRTDGTWYNVVWAAGNPSYMYSCDSVRILSSDGAIRANIYYDNQDTSYYADFHSTSQSAIRVRGGALHGPNPTWGKYLLVGGDGRQGYVDNTDVASISTTNGNLHIDAASGYGTYINWYDGSEITFGRGNSGGISAFVNSSGLWNFGTGSSASYLIHARGDIYADGGWLRVSGTSGLYFESYGGGWHMSDSTFVRSYNSKSVYSGSGIFRTDAGDTGFQNLGTANWYLLDFGDRAASAGRYGVGLTSDINNRTLSFHVPNHAAYSSSGNVPKFGWYSNGADELMTLQSATGNLWTKGSVSIAGNTALHAGNYNSYSPTLTGGGASGTWGISISGNATTTSQTSFSTLSVSGDLNAYAGAINVNRINFKDTSGSSASDPYCIRWISESSARGAGLSWLEFQLNDDNNEEIRIYGNSCAGYSCGAISDNLYHRFRSDGYAWHAGTLQADGDMRAPIFYDSANTSYYLDLNNTGTAMVAAGNISAASFTVTGGFTIQQGSSSSYGKTTNWLEMSGHGIYTTSNTFIDLDGATSSFSVRGYNNDDFATFSNTATGNASRQIAFLQNGGKLGIGLSNPDAILDVSHTAGTTNIIRVSNGAGNYRWRVDQNFNMYMTNASGVDTFSVTTAGNLTAASITETSTVRIKENISPIEDALGKVEQLKPVSYNKKGSETKEIGLIAEDVFHIYPEFVLCDDDGQPLGVHYSRLTAVLIESVKELKTKIQELEKRN